MAEPTAEQAAPCGSSDEHMFHDFITGDFKREWCRGVCLCGSTHPDITQGPHGPGEHK